jgi:hypothetical protein
MKIEMIFSLNDQAIINTMTTSFTEYVCEPYLVTDLSQLKSMLDTNGVAIVPGVLSEQECFQLESGMWDFFEHITSDWSSTDQDSELKPVNRNKPETWRQLFELQPKKGQLYQHFDIGHSQFAWDVRQNPNVAEVFASIYSVPSNDLLVSYDGASFHMPPEITGRGYAQSEANAPTHHVDQSFGAPDLRCVQGWVTARDIDDGDATLSFIPKSHNLHVQFGNEHPETKALKKHWYSMSDEEQQWYLDHGEPIRRIRCPKGSVVLWDSRTVHCGVQSLRTRVKPNIRCITYVCYQPRSYATEKQLKNKQKRFTEMRTTSHWPVPAIVFPKEPHTRGIIIPKTKPIDAPVLTELGRRLAGFD